MVLANVADLRARGIDVDSVSRELARVVRALPGVRRVYTPGELAAARATDAEAMRWRRQIAPNAEWLITVALETGWVWGTGTSSTGHGTTNLDDIWVPVLFRVPGVPAARHDNVVRTIDIAPTLAALLGLRPSERVEGIPLLGSVRR